MALFRHDVRPGMRVTTSDGQDAGCVVRTRLEGFVITNPPSGEVMVPYDAVQNVLGEEIVLSLTAGRLSGRSA